MLTRRKDRARLTPKDIEPLGTAGGFEFVTFEGAEYFLEADPMASVEKPPAPGEIRVTEQRERLEFGTRMTYQATRRGIKVESGTFAKYQEKDQRLVRASANGKRQRLVPVLSLLPRLARRPARILTQSETRAAYVEGVAPSFSAAATIADLRKSGHDVVPVGVDKVLILGKGGTMVGDQLEQVRRNQRLVNAELRGVTVACELDHGHETPPSAAVIVAVDVAVCAAHASGALPVAGAA